MTPEEAINRGLRWLALNGRSRKAIQLEHDLTHKDLPHMQAIDRLLDLAYEHRRRPAALIEWLKEAKQSLEDRQ